MSGLGLIKEYISRVKNERDSFVQLTIVNEVYQELGIDFQDIKKVLSKFIEAEKTIVFEMDVKELLLKFRMSNGKTSNYKTLKIISEE